MKASLQPALTARRRLTVDVERTIAFMGSAARLYATPSLVQDMEIICRELLLNHIDIDEDSVGVRVEIDHLAATLEGMWVEISVRITETKGRLVTFEIEAHDAVEQIARGKHTRFVGSVERTRQSIAAKAAKAKALEAAS